MTFQELIALLEGMGLEPRPYSGRGMYGKQCVGVSVTHPGDYELPAGWSQDALGRRYIIYWRNVPWQGE